MVCKLAPTLLTCRAEPCAASMALSRERLALGSRNLRVASSRRMLSMSAWGLLGREAAAWMRVALVDTTAAHESTAAREQQNGKVMGDMRKNTKLLMLPTAYHAKPCRAVETSTGKWQNPAMQQALRTQFMQQHAGVRDSVQATNDLKKLFIVYLRARAAQSGQPVSGKHLQRPHPLVAILKQASQGCCWAGL